MKISISKNQPLPVVRVGEIPRVETAQRWLVEGLWGDHSVGVIGGAPKCSKTWLGLDMAMSVATGTACLGQYAVPEPGPVLVCLAIDENHASEVAELLAYFRALQRQLDLSVLLVHHTRKNAAGGVAVGQGLRGSSEIHAFGDSNLHLRRTQEHLVLSSEHRAAPASHMPRNEI